MSHSKSDTPQTASTTDTTDAPVPEQLTDDTRKAWVAPAIEELPVNASQGSTGSGTDSPLFYS